MPTDTSKQGSSTGRLGPPATLSRNNSHTSQRSIHSQRSHSSQTHHVTPSDPSTLANLIHGYTNDEDTSSHHPHHGSHVHPQHGSHVHPQHKNLFVAQDGATGMPSFEELVVTEQRDWMEGVEEDEERDEEEERERQGTAKKTAGKDADRRRSVTFQQAASSSSTTSTAVSHSDEGSPTSRSIRNAATGGKDATERDPLLPATKGNGQGDDSIYDPTKDPHEWARIREGSIARRSRWRRPGPYW
jgi:hypothetical protein